MGYLGWGLFGLLLTALILAAAYVCYRIAFYHDSVEEDIYAIPPGECYKQAALRLRGLVDQLVSMPFEEVSITSYDGLKLFGGYYHNQDGAPVQIQFHGYRSHALRDFSGGCCLAQRAGENILLVDQRAHGKSQGHTITFGIKERYDCLAWARYAAKRFGKSTPILLSGVSMGAATVLMASALNLPENVVGVLADCPYSTPGRIIRKVCRDVKLPVWVVSPIMTIGALVYGHFCLWADSPRRAVRKAKVPVLIIHGEADRFVPCNMSREIYKACKEKITLETFPGADHGISYAVDPERYTAIVRRFLAGCIPGFL